MARTERGEALTETWRLLQIRAAARLARNLATLYRGVSADSIRATLEPFALAGGVVTLQARRSVANAARDYYLAFREVEGVEGPPPDVRPSIHVPEEVIRGGLYGAAARGMMNARDRGETPARARLSGLAAATGAATQIMANGGRETVLNAVVADQEAKGYQRVTDGDPCAFCRMLASRGIVAYTAASAAFKSHGSCGCTAEPAFPGSTISERNAQFRAEWDQVSGTRGGADALSDYRRFVAAQRKPATG